MVPSVKTMRLYLHLFLLSISIAANAAKAKGDVVEGDSSRLTPTLQLGEEGAAVSDSVSGDPISSVLEQILSGSLSELKNHDVTSILIENEIADNSFVDSTQDGLVFSPSIKVENNMHGAFVGNNNAESQSGNVKRQNGVADFESAFTDNNNAHAEGGDVVRQNGVIADAYNGQDADAVPLHEDMDTNHPPTRRLEHESESTSENGVKVDSSPTDSSNSSKAPASTSAFDFGPIPLLANGIVIRNKVAGNTVTKTKQTGLIVTPDIAILNDMSEAFRENNNAKSVDGNVARQNGVSDFQGAFQGNNKAYTTDGNIKRQNGILGLTSGDAASILSPEMIKAVLDSISNLEGPGGAGAGEDNLSDAIEKELLNLEEGGTDPDTGTGTGRPSDASSFLEFVLAIVQEISQFRENNQSEDDLNPNNVLQEVLGIDNIGSPSLEEAVNAYREYRSASEEGEDVRLRHRYLRGCGGRKQA